MSDMEMYRRELKYEISFADYLAIRQRLRPVMKPDEHALEDGRYVVRSVYFDNIEDKVLREKISGVAKREKFRIRYYNDDLSFISLEKKLKYNNLCMKKDAGLTEADAMGGGEVNVEYEISLFGTDEPMTVNIIMDEEDWEEMLANATAETYYPCDVEVNGETFYRVGIRPKGNTSLLAIASDPDTDRYSFKLEFDQYVNGQTCCGLDKLVLNNNYADATNMKEALIYDMYQYLGADDSLYNYAEIYVNGEYWGVYLALEAGEDSFLLRNYGTENGELYKPDSMNIGGGFDAFYDRTRSQIDALVER